MSKYFLVTHFSLIFFFVKYFVVFIFFYFIHFYTSAIKNILFIFSKLIQFLLLNNFFLFFFLLQTFLLFLCVKNQSFIFLIPISHLPYENDSLYEKHFINFYFLSRFFFFSSFCVTKFNLNF